MKIELKPGEKIEVTFFETDGLISVEYGDENREKKEAPFIKVYSDLPDNTNREGVIYFEQCNHADENYNDEEDCSCPNCNSIRYNAMADSETDYTECNCNCGCVWRINDEDNKITIIKQPAK